MKQSYYSLRTGINTLIIIGMVTIQSGLMCAQNVSETWINVFVHGIMSVKPHIGVSNFIRFMTDNVDNTVYSDTVHLMRHDPIFFQNQAMQNIGLYPMDPTRVEKGNASGAMALTFEQMSRFANPDKQIHNIYYTYGWSGLMSVSRRYTDAIGLYRSVAQKVAELKVQGINPKVRIIGYSHGGNVLLNLALVRQREQNPHPLEVDELFLLGVPVQSETDYLVNDPMFKKIYHIYSRGDRIQKLDFFSFKRFFSRRLFKPRAGFTLPDKLMQIQLKCIRNPEYLCGKPDRQAIAYNFKSKAIRTGRSHYLRDSSPGHTELWFFGWTPLHYRRTFPLYPFPAAALVPLIARYAYNFQERMLFQKPTLIDIRPEQEVVLVRNQKCKKTIVLGKFLPQQELEQLKEKVLLYAPDNYSAGLYNGAIRTSYLQAREWHVQEQRMCRQDAIMDRQERRRDRKTRKRRKKICAEIKECAVAE